MFYRTILSWSFAACPAAALAAAVKLRQSTRSEIDLNGNSLKNGHFQRNELQVDKPDQFQGLIMTENRSGGQPVTNLATIIRGTGSTLSELQPERFTR
jgi:hypothetical protein